MSSMRDMTPEAYAEMLRGQGVSEDDIPGRMAREILVAVREQLDRSGVSPGLDEFYQQLRIVLELDKTFKPNEIVLAQQMLVLAKEVRRTSRRTDLCVFVLKVIIVIGVLVTTAKYFW